MFKKFMSMATATLVLVGGLSVAAAPSASASSVSTLNLPSSSIKGVALATALESTSATSIQDSAYLNEITLTPAQAAGSAPLTFVASDAGAIIRVLTNTTLSSISDSRFDDTGANPNMNSNTSAIYDGNYIGVRVVSQDSTTRHYYTFKILAPGDATLSSISIKGMAATLGTPSYTLSSVVAGAVTISSSLANSSTTSRGVNTDVTIMTAPNMLKFGSGQTPSTAAFSTGPYFTTGMIMNGDIIVLKALASPPTNFLYYKVVVTVGSISAPSSSSGSDAAAIAAAAKAAAEKVAAAKVTLVDAIKAGKPITATDLNAADFTIASSKAAERVNAQVQSLPESQRADLATIKVIVQKENFVEKVSTSSTQGQVNTTDLVRVGLLPADYKNKAEVVRTLVAIDPSALTSIEKVEAAVKAAQSAIQARKDRLAATIKKIYGAK